VNRKPTLLPLLSLALAACGTENAPLVGYDKPPDGTLLLQGTAPLQIEGLIDVDAPQTFRLRFNGLYGVIELSSGPGPYDYLKVDVQEWIAGTMTYANLPAGTYVIELVDASGTSWGQTPPIDVQELNGARQPPIVVFVHLDGQMATWVLDPATADSDPTTMETTVTNLSHDSVTVQRCPPAGTAGGSQACTSLGTIAPGADLHTVEMLAMETTTSSPTAATVSTLMVGSYQRLLVGAPLYLPCEIERIAVTGVRTLRTGATTQYAFSACNAF